MTFSGSVIGPARVQHGTLTFAGTADFARGWTFTGSGGLGIVFAGTAGFGFGFIATGGLTFAGSADLDTGKDYVGTGGMILSGIAGDLNRVKYGELVFAGLADVQQGWTVTPTGKLLFGDTATLRRLYIFLPTGELVFAGEGGWSIALPGTGGFSFGGSSRIEGGFEFIGGECD